MELVQPQTYKKSFHLYEADKGRVPHSIEHEIRDFGEDLDMNSYEYSHEHETKNLL